MKKQNIYEVKDVVFGLRKEYLEIQKKLNDLESKFILPSENDKLEYELYYDEEGIRNLKVSLLKRQSIILEILKKIGKTVMSVDERKLPLVGDEHTLVIADQKKILLPEFPNGLYYTAEQIFTNRLVQDSPRRFTFFEPYTDNIDIKREVNISPFSMAINSWELKSDDSDKEEIKRTISNPSEFLSYLPDSDVIRYASYYDLAMSPLLSRCLESPFDGRLLTSVQRNIIDNSGVRDKKVTVESQSILRENVEYKIEETHDEIRLALK